MYEHPGNIMESSLSGAQSSGMSGCEEPSLDMPKTLVVVLSTVLLFSFVAVLAVLLIGSHGPDKGDNGRSNGDDVLADANSGRSIPSPPVSVRIPVVSRREPSLETVAPGPEPRTARTLSATHPPGVQNCPVGIYNGKRVGKLYGFSHDISGVVYAASNSIIVITNLNYNGRDPEARFWAIYKQTELKEGEGDQLPDENGSNAILKAYTNATVHLKLPKIITAYLMLGIYNTRRNRYIGYAWIPVEYDLPKEQILGKPISRFGNVFARDVVLTDSATMKLKRFVNHGHCPHTYFVAAQKNTGNPEDLTYLIHDGDKMGELESYNGTDLTIQLPRGCHWNYFKWFSAYCVFRLSSLADINIDTSVSHQLPLHSPEHRILL